MRNQAVTMSPHPAAPERPNRLWISFLHITFGACLVLVGGGIVALPLDWELRSGFAAGLVALVWSSFTLGETMVLISQDPAQRKRRENESPGGGPAQRGI